MSPRLWLPALAALIVAAAPAAAQDKLSLAVAIETALVFHPSIVEARVALESTTLSLRLAEIDHSHLTVSLDATPMTSSVSFTPWEDSTFDNVVDTFDANAKGSLSARVNMPWGMSITGAYTAGVDLDDPDRHGLSEEGRFTDAQALSISQDLLPAGRLSPTAVALTGRRNDQQLARLRLRRTQTDVAQQVVETFLGLTEQTTALAMAEERLAIAEREFANTKSLADQQAADQIALLGAWITAIERRNTVTNARTTLALETAGFFANLDLPETVLIAPSIDSDALRGASEHLLRASAEMANPDNSLAVMETRAKLEAARLHLAQTRRGSLPSLSLSVDYTKSSGTTGLGDLSVSVTGSYTLYDGGRQAIAVQQAEVQANSAQRALVSAQITAEQGLKLSELDLERAIVAEEMATLRWERARLQAEQAGRRHAAGVISVSELTDAALPLQEAEDAVLAAVHALSVSYLALAIDLSVDLKEALAAIAK